MFNFQPFGVGYSGTLAYVLNGMLGTLDPTFSVPNKRLYTQATLDTQQRLLGLLGYEFALDEQMDPVKWQLLSNEYLRMTGREVATMNLVVRESLMLDDIHARIAMRTQELQAELDAQYD